eukprot:784977-Amphidinium_carterae.1
MMNSDAPRAPDAYECRCRKPQHQCRGKFPETGLTQSACQDQSSAMPGPQCRAVTKWPSTRCCDAWTELQMCGAIV